MKHITSSPYHPQTQGALEKWHSSLKEYLRHFVNKVQDNWDDYLESAIFCYNTIIHSTTQFTLFEIIFGNKASVPNSITWKPDFHYNYDDYHEQLKLKLNKTFEIARENIIKSKEKSKSFDDRKIHDHINYKVGDKVYVSVMGSTPELSKKLSSCFKGPYTITKIHKNHTVTLKLKNKEMT
ncbi:hypothetical protein BDFB_012640 [Asbolus verrucosus]|uniref:Integrase catalytic domain-containing protein n=1 Tax=Asbolus verrucosus TaxID=1661398 RepID=A0A482VPU0_ASBVE|nr:hypothetical protein BDFB_012640 [Asbolus verrucosus]